MKNKKLKIFLSRKISVVAAVLLLFMMLVAFIGPFLTVHDPDSGNIWNAGQGMSREHWLGTDHIGRDFFTRIIHGMRLSIGLALFGVSIGLSFGLVFGLISGYYGGVTDAVISRFNDFLMAVPTFMIAIISLAILGSGGINTGIAVGLSGIPSFMRITRSQVIAVKDLDYVKSCRITGMSDTRIIIRHILPGVLPIIAVTFTLNWGAALLTATTISFLGLGVNPPTSELGALVNSGMGAVRNNPGGVIFPTIPITLFVMCTSLIGDGLRDAFDPAVYR